MQPVLDKVSPASHSSMTTAVRTLSSGSRIFKRALERVTVETCVRFDSVSLSSEEIVGLQVGDIVPLDHSIEHPVTISVDDVSCNKAVTGRRGKRLACLVVDAAQEQDQ